MRYLYCIRYLYSIFVCDICIVLYCIVLYCIVLYCIVSRWELHIFLATIIEGLIILAWYRKLLVWRSSCHAIRATLATIEQCYKPSATYWSKLFVKQALVRGRVHRRGVQYFLGCIIVLHYFLAMLAGEIMANCYDRWALCEFSVPIVPEGSYFLFVKTDALPLPDQQQQPENERGLARDFQLAYHLIRHYKLATIPPTAFYGPEHQELGTHYLRFCFCKTERLLDAAVERLAHIGQDIQRTDAK